jgi:uncharacterized protein with PQ loop repeat
MHGFHHLRARVRMTQGLEKFPSPNALKRFLDYLMYGVGIFAPLAYIPQVHKIYSEKSVAGFEITTWILVATINSLWALYGLVHKDKQLFLANFLIVIVDLTIVFGILLYS